MLTRQLQVPIMEDAVKQSMEEFPVSQMEYDSSSNVIYASAGHAGLHYYLD